MTRIYKVKEYRTKDQHGYGSVFEVGHTVEGLLVVREARRDNLSRWAGVPDAPVWTMKEGELEQKYPTVIADADGVMVPLVPKEPDIAFAPGDVVILPSGGCRMTVVFVHEDEVRVVWQDEVGKLREASMPATILRRFDQEEFKQR